MKVKLGKKRSRGSSTANLGQAGKKVKAEETDSKDNSAVSVGDINVDEARTVVNGDTTCPDASEAGFIFGQLAMEPCCEFLGLLLLERENSCSRALRCKIFGTRSFPFFFSKLVPFHSTKI